MLGRDHGVRQVNTTSTQRRQRGQALIEFALIFPIMILVIVAIFDLGRLVFAYNNITNAARTGVRVAMVDQTSPNARTATKNQATSLGLVDSNVTVLYLASDLASPCPTPMTLDCVAEITVTYGWDPLTPLIGNIVGPVTVTSVSRQAIERIYP